MKKRESRVQIGSVSHGTLREEDLIESFLWELEHNTGSRGRAAYRKILRDNVGYLLNEAGELIAEEDFEGEDVARSFAEDVGLLLNEEILPALDDLAPPFCYFGSHEGDGSDFGFWVSQDAIDEAIHDGEVWKDPDDGFGGKPRSCPKSASYRLVVSDHGNMTLYYRNGKEVWGIV